MSTYQYYEFLALDRPLNDREMKELRSLSTRADITSTRFVNEYHWGDFRGNPAELVERYFDVFFYYANWGSRQLTIRLPHKLLDWETASQYCCADLVRAWTTDEHVILDFTSSPDDEDDEFLGWSLSSLLGVRDELARGDLRALYLGWLLSAQAEELDEDELEPPVPPNLGSLSAPQRAFADFFRINDEMLAAAAKASPTTKQKTTHFSGLGRWIEKLPPADKDAMLLRVAQGEGIQVQTRLLQDYTAQNAEDVPLTAPERTVGELFDTADALLAEKIRAERERKELKARERAEREAAEREKRLAWVTANEESCWQKVDTLIETKQQTEYEKAADLLVDLKAVAERQNRTTEFDERFAAIRDRHRRKVSLLDRFTRAGL